MTTEAPDPTLTEKAEAALQQAAISVIERARQTGTPVIVWENGRVAERTVDELKPGPGRVGDRDQGRIVARPSPGEGFLRTEGALTDDTE
jgi:hypothetical protein